MRFAAHFADALLVDNANARAVTTENSFGEIDTLRFRERALRSRALQFDTTAVAKETLWQNPGATGRANSPADRLSTMGTFHNRKLLEKLDRWGISIITIFSPIVQHAGAQPAQKPGRERLSIAQEGP